MQKRFKFFDFLGLLGGFIYGNLFAINYSSLNWNFLILFCVIFFLEIINKMFYKNLFNNSIGLENRAKNRTLRSKNTASQKINFWDNNPFTKNEFSVINSNVFWNLSSTFTVNFWVLINTLKRGFLLGLFVEAFKVGS